MKWLAIITIAVVGSRSATADPALGHVFSAPTAWLPAPGTVVGSAGIDTQKKPSILLGVGLGDIAEVEAGADADIATCAAPPCNDTNTEKSLMLGRAAFRIGAHQNALFVGQPAVVLGFRTTFAGLQPAGFARPRTAEAYLVASRIVGPLALHAGASLIDAGTSTTHMFGKVRPLGAIEFTPPQYPKTTLALDIAWVARLEPTVPALEYLFGWGVRYQALTWGSIELDVRHRELDPAGPTVMVRVNGVWDR